MHQQFIFYLQVLFLHRHCILTVSTKYYYGNETYNYRITFQVYKNQFNNIRARIHARTHTGTTVIQKAVQHTQKKKKTNVQTANPLKIEG
jgi:hypothetical protein